MRSRKGLSDATSRKPRGVNRSAISREGREMGISYAIADCSLGRLLVAGTTRGVSAIYLGDADAALEIALRNEYSGATIHRDSAPVAHWVDQVLQHLAGKRTQLRLPLDVRATAFQRQVWRELQKIPAGSRRTYSEISRLIGRPKA